MEDTNVLVQKCFYNVIEVAVAMKYFFISFECAYNL